MIIRNDLRPDHTIIPKALQETILRVGGRNIFDEPLYRLIRAEDHITKAAGLWPIFRKGLSVDERGGMGIKEAIAMMERGCDWKEVAEFMHEYRPATPERVVRGMVENPVYPYNGFIIEKWKPAESFGSPEAWYEHVFEGEPSLGPYPTEGAYELAAGPTPYMPSAEQIETAIRRSWKQLQDKPQSAQARVTQHMRDIELALEQQNREQANKIQAILKEDTLLYKTISLGAGRVIQERALKCGIKSHYGN